MVLATNGATTKKTIDKASEPLPIPEGFVSYYKHLKYCSEDRDYDCSRWVSSQRWLAEQHSVPYQPPKA